MYIGKLNPPGMPEVISVIEITTPCDNPEHPSHTHNLVGNAAEVATVCAIFQLDPADVVHDAQGLHWSYPDGREVHISTTRFAYDFIERVTGGLPPEEMFKGDSDPFGDLGL